MELSADRALFGRMIIACRLRPEIDLLETIGTYKLSVVPRSLFALDGTMHHVSKNSELMYILSDVCEVQSIVNKTFSAMFEDVLKSFIVEVLEVATDATEKRMCGMEVDFKRVPAEDTTSCYKIAIIDGRLRSKYWKKQKAHRLVRN